MAIPKLPDDAVLYRQTAVFTETTIPAGLLGDHRTKEGTWGVIRVLEGKLTYRIRDKRCALLEFLLTPTTIPGVIEPTITHEIEPCGPVRFFVEFYRRGETSS